MKKITRRTAIGIAIIAIVVLFAATFIAATALGAAEAKQACVQTCKAALGAGQNLSAGPCLSNNITIGWACDVAHNPRLSSDNFPANQCSAYPTTAKHFVELDTNCSVIRVV